MSSPSPPLNANAMLNMSTVSEVNSSLNASVNASVSDAGEKFPRKIQMEKVVRPAAVPPLDLDVVPGILEDLDRQEQAA